MVLVSQFYTDPSREKEKYALPNAETFFAHEGEWENEEGEPNDAGWYYWYCFPGCLPDSDPWGPFETEEEAIEHAREENES